MVLVASLLLIHGDEGLREVAARYLESHGHQVAVAKDELEGLRLLADLTVDLVILQGTGEMSCDEFCHWLRADPEREKVPVLFIVGRGAIRMTRMLPGGYRDGVDGVIARPFQLDDMVVAVQRLLAARQGQEERAKRLLQVGTLTLDLESQEILGGGQSMPLTPTEFRLLHYLVQKAGSVASKDELLENVWGFYPGTGSAEVVRTHIRNLRSKIAAVHGPQELIQTLPRRGYRVVL